MAKHFKEESVQKTATMRVQRAQEIPRANVRTEENTTSMPYGQAATYRGSYADAAPTGGFFVDDLPARGGIYAFGRGVLLALAWVFRLLAIAAVAIVLLNVLSLSVTRQVLTNVTDTITAYLPWSGASVLMVDTPFGGVFRGDIAIVAVALFVIDWLLCKARKALR